MSKGPHQDHVGGSGALPSEGFDAAWLAAVTKGNLERAGHAEIHGGAVDSRRIRPGNAFFALAGERTDGHRHLAAAVAAGAAALVVSEALPDSQLDELSGSGGSVAIVRVDDVPVALRAAAAAYRDRFDPVTVGITGSIAKTSTKEQTATVLGERFTVLRNEGNENNEIGLPLTLLRLERRHEAAVLEMGLYTTGEIALLAQLARPSIGVVTAVRGVHLSRAGSIEAIERGKRELVEALPSGGWAILNADDPRVAAMAGHTPAQVLRYGFDAAADIGASDVTSLGFEGMRYRLHLPSGAFEVTSSVLGRHGVHNALAAAAVATCVGLEPDEIVRGLRRPMTVPHRSQVVRAGDWTILDDAYNASPDAVISALGLLSSLPGRHVAVLGEMLELGETAAPEHVRVGRMAGTSVDRLVVVGSGAAGIAEGAALEGLPAHRIELVPDREAALVTLLATLEPGDTVLFKASQASGFGPLVEELVASATGEASA